MLMKKRIAQKIFLTEYKVTCEPPNVKPKILSLHQITRAEPVCPTKWRQIVRYHGCRTVASTDSNGLSTSFTGFLGRDGKVNTKSVVSTNNRT